MSEQKITWVAISGSWRATSAQVEDDVRGAVKDIIESGNGIVSGGALNVDYFATDEAMRWNPRFDRIKVFLPTTLDIYAKHYRNRASEGVIALEQAEELIKQLTRLKETDPTSLIEHPTNQLVNLTTYFERNGAVIEAADELLAFQVNNSGGVEDTIQKALAKGIPVKRHNYSIEEAT